MRHRSNGAATWAVGDDDRLRIDHRHIFLGTVDVGGPGGAYAPADALPAALALLEGRQSCTRPGAGACGAGWRYADLSTFEIVAEPPNEWEL